jgi:hypothetical protein
MYLRVSKKHQRLLMCSYISCGYGVMFFKFCESSFEPRHDKTNIVRLRQAWIQTSLCICKVWSGSMLFSISFSTCNRVGKRTAWILIRLYGCAGRSRSMVVANAVCWFCRDAAHFYWILLFITCMQYLLS